MPRNGDAPAAGGGTGREEQPEAEPIVARDAAPKVRLAQLAPRATRPRRAAILVALSDLEDEP